MTNNEILKQICNALNLQDKLIIEIFQHNDFNLTPSQLKAVLKKEQDPGFVKCKDAMLLAFLDGLIIHKRGKIENKAPALDPTTVELSNNQVLKKLRVALKFHESDMLAVLQKADLKVTKSELNALFRKPGHKNYKSCDDKFLIGFLTGLSSHFEKD